MAFISIYFTFLQSLVTWLLPGNDDMESEEILLLTWLSIICIVGLPSNILVLIVYSCQKRITKTKRLIIALAISDIIGCIALLLQLSLIAASLGRSKVFCFSSVFSISLTGTFTNFLVPYISIYQYKNSLYLNSAARVQHGKKDVILYIIFGLGALIVSLPSLFLTYSGTNNKCFYSSTLLLLISITMTLITLCSIIVIIVYSKKIFSLTRKRQLIIRPAPNEQENHLALTVQNISQSVPCQQTISFTDLNKLFLASELAEGTTKPRKKNCYLQDRTTTAWADTNDDNTSFQENISAQGVPNKVNPAVEITHPENTLTVTNTLQNKTEDHHNSKDGIGKPPSVPFGATVEQNQPIVNLSATVDPQVNTCPAAEPHQAIVNPSLQQDDNIPKEPSCNRSPNVLSHS